MLPYGTIYLSGARTPLLDAQMRYAVDHANMASDIPPIGILITPKTPDRADDLAPGVQNIYPFVGIDNGCFSESGRRRYQALGLNGYIKMGLRALDLWGDDLLFITAPDVPMNWQATLEESLPVLPVLRAHLPHRAALVLQDGATPSNIPWDALDWIFLGGSTEWKISPIARACAKEARRRHVGVHMGRVNSLLRLNIAQNFGCDSADGTYLLHEEAKGQGEKAVETIFQWARHAWREAASGRGAQLRRVEGRAAGRKR